MIAHNQQIVRYDIEGRSGTESRRCDNRFSGTWNHGLRELSCIVVSDYAKGVVSPTLMSELTRLAALRKVPVIVDPKVEHFSYYKGARSHAESS